MAKTPDVTVDMGQKENHMDDEPKWERCTFHATERGSISSGWDGESDITSFAVILVGPEKHRFLLSEIPVKLKATCHRSYLTPSVVQLHLLLFWLYDSSHILLGVESHPHNAHLWGWHLLHVILFLDTVSWDLEKYCWRSWEKKTASLSQQRRKLYTMSSISGAALTGCQTGATAASCAPWRRELRS